MDNFIETLAIYDWNIVLKTIVALSSIAFVFFWKKLDKLSDFFIALPFFTLVSYSIYKSSNLIALIFFIEISLSLKEVLFKINIERFEKYYFRLLRIPMWIFSIYCYYVTFGTFEFIDVVQRTDIHLSLLYINLVIILMLFIQGFLYRKSYVTNSRVESLVIYSILTPAICLKLFSLLANWTDLLLPEHHSYINILLSVICLITFILSIRYFYISDVNDLVVGLNNTVLSSLFPMLVFVNQSFWSGFSFFALKLILLFCVFHVFYQVAAPTRSYKLLMFLLLCEISGIGPNGHIFAYFGGLEDYSDQLMAVILLFLVFLSISFVLKSIVKSMRMIR